mmetsp:Transcript_16686/g.29553  ORF Transcript_16686/g.29553 Transcript_16686/m.29553 type:complete len:90 (+) Transcript_16686:109-378(+)|eukprot:CAMPEP_0184526698 /NCGR_PEP_ID=MMETSP0198_2-20121128/10793_1 /TAXON_ID=1112570 /ORGANISM="Thraustochytrium sp., Strain LLF1b" /LENGTH=89 /DNA_ID=CAMNT_0026918287 /DNA_START=176 /DNA_END=445 /DNA_ORIENTATION=+
MGHQETVDRECEELKKDVARLGEKNEAGQYQVEFGTLFDDDKAQQYYEAIVGTLKAARTKGFIDWKGQMLLKGAHDKVIITLLVEPTEA